MRADSGSGHARAPEQPVHGGLVEERLDDFRGLAGGKDVLHPRFADAVRESANIGVGDGNYPAVALAVDRQETPYRLEIPGLGAVDEDLPCRRSGTWPQCSRGGR